LQRDIGCNDGHSHASAYAAHHDRSTVRHGSLLGHVERFYPAEEDKLARSRAVLDFGGIVSLE